MYECRLPEKKRRLFTVLSDIGRMILFAGVLLYMACGADGLGTVIISATFLLTLLACAFALVGMIVMIFRRLKRIDCIVTKKQLVCGFGFTVYGALAAGVFSLVSVIADLALHCESGIFLMTQCVMCAGGWLCFAFGLPILKACKKQ